jgi:uncharacterized membrane protein
MLYNPRMTWSTRFRIRESARGSLWLIPLLGAVIGAVLGTSFLQAHQSFGMPSFWEYSPSTATTVLASIVGATAALTGFVITVTVLVVQTAISTFSARYMRLWYRDLLLKLTLAVLVGTLTFALGLLRDIQVDYVPNLGVTVAGWLTAVGLILFFLFFHRFIQRIRPVAVSELVAQAGKRAHDESVRAVAAEDVRDEPPAGLGEPTLVVRTRRAGSIQAVHVDGLVRFASSRGARVVLTSAVGDFVPRHAALVRVYGGDRVSENDADELRGLIALGVERTIQQDPAFAIRILVDIAIRALSPAVNDPTTAVQVIDYLGETLAHIGAEPPPAQPSRDGAGPCVVLRQRRWEDVVALAITEIRQYGATSIQVVRRLRAMLVELDESVAPEHRAAIEDELRRLDATVSEHWSGSVDLDRANVAGRQGIGGPTSS